VIVVIPYLLNDTSEGFIAVEVLDVEHLPAGVTNELHVDAVPHLPEAYHQFVDIVDA
jgi:hypothetical protein